MNKSTIFPGAAIGVLGSGQLGRMFALAARQMGYRVHTFSPETDTPTGQVSDVEIEGSYDDIAFVRKFAKSVDVITYEFENVPRAAAQACARLVPVRPNPGVLHIAQHRLREKTFLASNGFPVTGFRRVVSLSDIAAGIRELGLPCVLKTAGFGYDGKGQFKITAAKEAGNALQSLAGGEGILEAFVPFAKEVSVVAARGLDGEFAAFPLFENVHKNHILDVTLMPAGVSKQTSDEAVAITRRLFQKMKVVGLMCVEFFLTEEGGLLINEIAPRPHNSGHLTVDACYTSQFEQQLRAVCGLPLGSTEARCPAAMANLMGDLWKKGAAPPWQKILKIPGIQLHLYGKKEPRPGRKMGHITALAKTPQAALRNAINARSSL